MTYRRKFVIAILFCVLVAWTAGENGRFPRRLAVLRIWPWLPA